jgi:hypothetical protein
MPARDFLGVHYAPMLTVSVAEMRALEELPDSTKDALFPYFQLRPWGVSHDLRSTINRISAAYGDRPFLSDLCAPTTVTGEPRPVHGELAELRISEGGYSNWCGLIENHASMVPVLQLGNLAELETQTRRLFALDRGLGVYFPQPTFGRIPDIATLIGQVVGDGTDVVVILDLGQRGTDLLVAQATTVGLVRTVRERLPRANVAISASSFPSDFVGRPSQQIFERSHFEGVVGVLGADRLIYSDRGSARAERQLGGGGQPAPRVDLAGSESWSFFRDGSGGDRIDGYIAQAALAMRPPHWDGDLRVWGHQMIERTAGGDRNAIKSPTSSTAARINVHLHRQTFFGDLGALYQTDDEWED